MSCGLRPRPRFGLSSSLGGMPLDNFRMIDRETAYLLTASVDDVLHERHLGRFIVEVIDRLDLSAMSRSYRGTGSASYHPTLLLGLLVYGYATGVFSSRKLERATYDSVAFRFIAANDHPDHDTIATFRRRFLKEIERLFVQVLELAREMGMLTMGTVALDGTKIHANASRHSALSYEHAGKIEAQLKAEVAADSLLVLAAQVVQAPNDKQQIEPMLKRIEALRADLGKPETLLADNGYFSDANVELCAAAQIDPMIALGRQSHHPSLAERFAKAPPAPENPTPLAAMTHRLQTPECKKLYALRTQIPEPLFAIITSLIGFRQFLLRGLDQVQGEWSLLTMASNMTRMYALAPA